MAKLIIATFLVLALCALVNALTPAGDSLALSGTTKADKFQCTWVTGKGFGLKAVTLKGPPRSMSGQGCIDDCFRRARKHKHLDAIVQYKDSSKKGCWCVYRVHDVDESFTNLRTCYFRPEKKAPAPDPKPLPPKLAEKLVTCKSNGYKPVLSGCYDVSKRRKYLYNERLTIDWKKEGHKDYAENFICACIDAAEKAGIMMFATHFWGECWELREEDLVRKSNDGCVLADGLYKTKTCQAGSACLGTTGYAVYTFV